MNHKRVKKTELKARSEQLNIPFSNLLAGYVKESLMRLIMDSPFQKALLLKNTNIFGVECYRQSNELTLEFAYLLNDKVIESGKFEPGQEVSLKMAYIMLACFLQKEKIPEIKWRGRAECRENRIFLSVNGEVWEMTVPIEIRVTPIHGEELAIENGEMIPFMEPEERVLYRCYPRELRVADDIFLIVRNMELLSEMRPYQDVYHILDKQLLDGRHVKELLAEYCEPAEIEPDMERIEEIFSYRDYSYMKKRWEKYIRNRRETEPDWDGVIDILEKFLGPIWEAVCKDEVFFGDWMPDLKRFL